MNKKLALAVAAVAVVGTVQAQSARDYISIVGSSTVYPFTTVLAEQFGKTTSFKTPKVESTGTGGGMKLFCAGVGVEHPDMTGASRRIKQSELEQCIANGVTDVIEVKIGYDGIVIANAKGAPSYNLTRAQLWQALAKQVPNPDGAGLVNNPYTMWSQIDASLPKSKIEVLGPPPTSGTRDAFVELVMDHGCEEFEAVKALDKDAKKAACQTVREDGAYIEAGENDNLIVQKLGANPQALGIFGFSFLDQNEDTIKGLPVDSTEPTFDNIADGSYPISRPLYVYAKKAHAGVIPGMAEFLAETTSEKAMGEEGYLTDKGLIPLPEAEFAEFQKAAKDMQPMSSL